MEQRRAWLQQNIAALIAKSENVLSVKNRSELAPLLHHKLHQKAVLADSTNNVSNSRRVVPPTKAAPCQRGSLTPSNTKQLDKDEAALDRGKDIIPSAFSPVVISSTRQGEL
jgi:hypothetical protein